MTESVLLTDLYRAHHAPGLSRRTHERNGRVRALRAPLPPQRDFLLAAGLEQALDYLENLRFTADERTG